MPQVEFDESLSVCFNRPIHPPLGSPEILHTSCDDLLEMPCSSHIDACSTSISCETNLLKENNELK